MRNRAFIYSSLILGSLLLILLILKLKKYQFSNESETIYSNTYTQRQFIERDLIEFELITRSNLLFNDLKEYFNDSDEKNDYSFLLLIPKEVCWGCIEEHLRSIAELTDSLDQELIIVCTDRHLRDVSIISYDFSKMLVYDIEEYSFINRLDENLLLIMCDQKNDLVFPYIELKGTEIIELIIKQSQVSGSSYSAQMSIN